MKKIIIILLLIHNAPVTAETLWKLGAGIGHISTNSYPGSNDVATITSPIPYLKIKTEWFDLDREGLHTNLFQQTNFRLDVTFDLMLPVGSDKTLLRKGMDDLDPVGLIGPMLVYRIKESEQEKWQLQLPLAYAYAVDDLELNSTGWTINPRLYWKQLTSASSKPGEFSVSLGPVYNSAELQDFYYSVAAADATTLRPEFLADEGFAGWRLNLALTRTTKKYWAGVYLRYQNLSGAKFENSPLVTEKDYWMLAFGLSWLFAGNL